MHSGLWQVMKNFNFDSSIIEIIETNKDASSAILQLITEVTFSEQGSILSPALFNMYLEHIMLETMSL